MELQSAGRLDGVACFHGSLTLHGSLLSAHQIPSSQGNTRPAWLDRRPAIEILYVCFKRPDKLLHDSNDTKHVLYILGPRFLRIYCFVLFYEILLTLTLITLNSIQIWASVCLTWCCVLRM